MVRLKDPTATFMEMYQLHFNSTMVRLKDPRKLPKPRAREFQFHYGTIKRKAEDYLLERVQ